VHPLQRLSLPLALIHEHSIHVSSSSSLWKSLKHTELKVRPLLLALLRVIRRLVDGRCALRIACGLLQDCVGADGCLARGVVEEGDHVLHAAL
jgi:hypothetical protein